MKILLCIGLLYPFLIRAQSQMHSAGSGENIPSLACLACAGTEWHNEMNIMAEDDSVSTTVLNPAGNCFMSICSYSRFLYAHHFNFDIPEDATIDSIFVSIRRAAGKPDAVRDSIVQLQKGVVMTGHNLQSNLLWPSVLAYESYGHGDPLWGTTWIPAEINDTSMGVHLKIVNTTSGNVEAAVDLVEMTVYYNTSTGTFSVTSSPGSLQWINEPGKMEIKFISPFPVLCSFQIFSVTGQLVHSQEYGISVEGENHFTCSTHLLDPGIYFFILKAGRQSFAEKIFISE